MAACEARARAAGRTRMTLHTTTLMSAAREMYTSLGYERSEDRVFPDGFVLLGYRRSCDPRSAQPFGRLLVRTTWPFARITPSSHSACTSPPWNCCW